MWRQRPQEDLINSKVCSTLSASRPENYSQHPIYHGTATTCIRHLRTDLPYFHIRDFQSRALELIVLILSKADC